MVLNWNSHWFTRRCLDALLATDADASIELVVVDNASVDGSLERLRAAYPEVTFVRNDRNLGFAEGCNRAMRDLDDADHVALVNNDAVPEPGWLAALLDAAEASADIGAVAARLVLEPSFCRIQLDVDGHATIDRLLVGGVDALDRTRFDGVESVGRTEWPMQLVHRLDGRAEALVPMGADTRDITVVASGRGTMRVSTSVDSAEVRLGDAPAPVSVSPDAVRVELLNGLGTDRTDEAEYFDRHFGEPVDPDQVPELSGPPRDVTGFSGGGVLLRADMLRQVGCFDPVFFAYYEDSDLSWRAARHGWRTVTAPGAVIRHSFGGSGGARATGFFLLNYRNWLLTVLRNADPALRRRVAGEVRGRVWWAVRANLLSALRRRRRPSTDLLMAWLRTLVAVVAARRAQVSAGDPPGSIPTDSVTSRFQPAFGPRSPSTRPGGPLLVYLELSGAGPWRELLLAARDDLEIVPVLAAPSGAGLRLATAAEVAAVLAADADMAPATVTSATGLDALSPRSCVLRRRDDATLELVAVGADGVAAADPTVLTLAGSDDGGPLDVALLCDAVAAGHRQNLG